MNLVPLRIGALDAPGFVVQRSGMRWLCEDGHLCRPGEVIAYCNLALMPVGAARPSTPPFADEGRDFQIAFAPRVGGRLQRSANSSLGGFLDLLPHYQRWLPDFVMGYVECPPGEPPPGYDPREEAVQLILFAGRRATEIAEDRSGLLTGWHDRRRAWRGDGGGRFGTLLSLGICEQMGVIRGERGAFLELFEALEGPVHIVHVADDVLVPCAAIVAEQIGRTAARKRDIAADFASSFVQAPIAPMPADWILAGALMSALLRSPLVDRYDVLTRAGLQHAGPADAVVLSLNSEAGFVFRHRRLGYSLLCHRFRIAEAGPAMRAWLQTHFEIVKRTPDDIRRDYRELVDSMRARCDTKFLIVNVMSTSGYEDVSRYTQFDRPLGDTLASVRSKELNLMLHDFARERDVAIVDLDAIAADFGAMNHLFDGIHHSGPVQAEMRQEILRILRDRGVPGFAPEPVR